jgi:hypothetical protein
MKLINSPYSLSLTQERRHVRRRKVDSVVYVNIGRDNGGVLLDLSEDGMCISVANPLTMSSEIHFALGLTGDRPVEGIGQVSWLSQSGKSVGVRFESLSNESRMVIRQWMAGATSEAKKTESTVPGKAADEGQQEKPLLNDPEQWQPDTQTAGGALHRAESRESLTMPHSPLFFLPKGPAADEVSEVFPSPPAPYIWSAEKSGTANNEETVQAFRDAIVAKTEEDEESSPEERRFKKAAIVFTVCFALLAASVAAVVAYPKRFAELRQITESLAAPSTVAPVAPVRSARSTHRNRREVARRPMFSSSGLQRGSRPVGSTGIFDAPIESGTEFSAGADASTEQGLLASASGPRLVPSEKTPDTTGAEPASVSAADNGPRTSTHTAQVGRLRVDGGLVEEGTVSPTFAPLNLDGQSLDSKPIVVEAVIGTDGVVKDVRLVSSPASSLAQAVMSSVKQWRYRPFYRNGKPIEFITRVTFDFSLPKGNTR